MSGHQLISPVDSSQVNLSIWCSITCSVYGPSFRDQVFSLICLLDHWPHLSSCDVDVILLPLWALNHLQHPRLRPLPAFMNGIRWMGSLDIFKYPIAVVVLSLLLQTAAADVIACKMIPQKNCSIYFWSRWLHACTSGGCWDSFLSNQWLSLGCSFLSLKEHP